MKRSEINEIMRDAVSFIKELGFKLPRSHSGGRMNGRQGKGI